MTDHSEEDAGADVPHHDELPVPDYDHLSPGSPESRLKLLDSEGVQKLLAYERAHADRVAVVQLVEARSKLSVRR